MVSSRVDWDTVVRKQVIYSLHRDPADPEMPREGKRRGSYLLSLAVGLSTLGSCYGQDLMREQGMNTEVSCHSKTSFECEQAQIGPNSVGWSVCS